MDAIFSLSFRITMVVAATAATALGMNLLWCWLSCPCQHKQCFV